MTDNRNKEGWEYEGKITLPVMDENDLKELQRVLQDIGDSAYKQAINKMRIIIKEMKETAMVVMNPDWEYACDRFLEQLKKI